MGKDLKGKELGKGITQRKDGRYQARFTDRFGKRRTVYGKTLKDIKNELHNEIVEDYRLNNTINPSITLDEWFDKWIRIYKQNYVKEVTILRYKSMYRNHVQEFLGRKRVNEINRLMVVDLIGNLNKNNFKKSTINCISRMLYDIFECAMADDVCTKNPMLKIKKLDESNKKGTALTLEQQIDFFNMSVNSYYNNLFITIVNTGMRFGDDDDKIRLNQRKPSKYKGLRRFGPEKNLQRINKFMKERPIFYKNLIQMKENIRFYLRCFYCITKVMILQFNSENRTELARNG